MKNLDYIILKTANDLDLDKETVKTLVNAYWNEVNRKVIGFETRTVGIRGVGTITISKYKLRDYILKKIRIIKRLKLSKKYSEQKKAEMIAEAKEKLRMALKHRDEIAKEYAIKFNQ